MLNLPQTLAQINTSPENSAILTTANIIFAAVYLTGLGIFIYWLLKTRFATRSLQNSTPRRNNMPYYAPLIPIAIWLGTLTIANLISKTLLPNLNEFHQALLENISGAICILIATTVALLLAWSCFVHRLKGFGLDIRTIHRDLPAAVLNLLSVWPLVMLSMTLIAFLGKNFTGEDFQMQRHQGLELILQHRHIGLRFILLTFVIILVPFFEEILFRGMLQTTFRSFFKSPWPAIIITSAIFAAIHSYWMHWPSLFILALCLGYAYEKEGSLFRPIFIHALFNATSVIAILLM